MTYRGLVRRGGAATLCLLVLVGCSDDDDDGDAPLDVGGDIGVNTGTEGGTSMPAPGTTPGAPAPTMFDGEWLAACTAIDPSFPDEGYEVATLTIAGDSGTARTPLYEDSACAIPVTPSEDEPFETVVSASIVYPGGTTETALGTATHVDITTESIEFDGEPPTEAQRAQLERIDAFGTDYDIALVSGSELFFGDFEADEALDGSSPERRPTALEPTGFVRQ